jgi:hypothetical protein
MKCNGLYRIEKKIHIHGWVEKKLCVYPRLKTLDLV